MLNKLEIGHNWKRLFEIITLVISFALLFNFFAAQGSLQSAKWLKKTDSVTIEYMAVTQIPSIVYSLIIFALYYMHLKRTDKPDAHPFWSKLEIFPKLQTDTAQVVEVLGGMKQELRFQQVQQFNTMNHGVPRAFQPISAKASLYGASTRWSTSIGEAAEQAKQDVVPDKTIKHLQYTDGQYTDGQEPVTNEISIFICVIFLLGGLADLGLLNGFILELEAQLVIISLISFCLLEIVLTQFHAYFQYLKNYWAAAEKKVSNLNTAETVSNVSNLTKHMTQISLIVHFTVLIMQIFIVMLLQYTRLSIIIVANYPEEALNRFLMIVVIGYMLLKLVIWLKELKEYLFPDLTNTANCCDCCTHCTGMNITNVLQLIVYYVSFGALWITVISILAHSGKHIHNDELKLVFNEQIMYERADKMTDQYIYAEKTFQYSDLNPELRKCATDFKDIFAKIDLLELRTNPHKISCSVSDWKENEVKLNIKVNTDVYKIENPVVMKVWAWTRFLVLQNQIVDKKCEFTPCEPASKLYCKNGFEQHWGQCKNFVL
jgi:hypothetical protein